MTTSKFYLYYTIQNIHFFDFGLSGSFFGLSGSCRDKNLLKFFLLLDKIELTENRSLWAIFYGTSTKGGLRMYIIAICEDDPIFLNALEPIIESHLRKLNTEYILDCFEDGESLVSEVVNSDVRYDAIFFDIALPGMSGIKAAKKIREIDESALFIFITSLSDKVYQVFQFDTFHFIRKSYFEKEIEPVLGLLIERLNRDCESYEFRTENGEITLRLNEIVYFERENRNIVVHTKDHAYITTNRNIKDLQLELGDKGFFEIYRGILINLSYGKYIKDSTLVLTIGKPLPISRRKLPEFKRIFFDSLQRGVI